MKTEREAFETWAQSQPHRYTNHHLALLFEAWQASRKGDACINITPLFTHPAPATEPTQVSCQLYGHVVGACGECNTHSEPSKLPENCGTGYCSCIECVKPAKPSAGDRAALIQQIEALFTRITPLPWFAGADGRGVGLAGGRWNHGAFADITKDSVVKHGGCPIANTRFLAELANAWPLIRDMLAADAQEIAQKSQHLFEALTECDGQALTIAKLKAQQVAVPQGPDAGTLRDMAGSAFEEAMAFGISTDSFERLARTVNKCAISAAPQQPQADAGKLNGDAHEIWAAAQLVPGEGIADGVARVEALLDAPRVPMTDDEIYEVWDEIPDQLSLLGSTE